MKNSLLNDNDELLLAPGDVLDKLSILYIKKRKIKNPRKRKEIQKEIGRTSLLWRNICNSKEYYINMAIPKLFDLLLEINEKQWDLEDRVRTEKSWETAKAARNNNIDRVKVKNEINRFFDYLEEIKEYKNDS